MASKLPNEREFPAYTYTLIIRCSGLKVASKFLILFSDDQSYVVLPSSKHISKLCVLIRGDVVPTANALFRRVPDLRLAGGVRTLRFSRQALVLVTEPLLAVVSRTTSLRLWEESFSKPKPLPGCLQCLRCRYVFNPELPSAKHATIVRLRAPS